MKIDTKEEKYYQPREKLLNQRTKKRLKEISDLGLEEVGIDQFGIKNIMSGLYLEKVWDYKEKDWVRYINWIKQVKIKKSQQR